jgi:hypothetical protein
VAMSFREEITILVIKLVNASLGTTGAFLLRSMVPMFTFVTRPWKLKTMEKIPS